MPFTIVRQDITRMETDAIVNAANADLAMGGGVCGAIFSAAGAPQLQAACDRLAPIRTGEAAITPGFNLPAQHIIHAVGPVYDRYDPAQAERHLRSAYVNSLQLAVENGCKSIAFPLISSGIYGYPKEDALIVATTAIRGFLANHDMDIYLVVFDKAAFGISEKLLGAVASYIDEHYAEERADRRRPLFEVERKAHRDESSQIYEESEYMVTAAKSLFAEFDMIIGNLDESFSATLLRLIDAKGVTDVAIYKRANLDRKLFSKIRSGNHYMPSKRTAIALAVALELSLHETENLLKCAGYALSRSQKFDVIVEYFITHGKYDIFEINEVLFSYDQALLGG